MPFPNCWIQEVFVFRKSEYSFKVSYVYQKNNFFQMKNKFSCSFEKLISSNEKNFNNHPKKLISSDKIFYIYSVERGRLQKFLYSFEEHFLIFIRKKLIHSNEIFLYIFIRVRITSKFLMFIRKTILLTYIISK